MTKALFTTLAIAASSLTMSACMPVPPTAQVASPIPATPAPVVQPVTPVNGIVGLEERQPDLCGAKQYVPYLSQPGSVIPSLGIAKDYRVVEYRGIEPQEYNPNRIVFRLDASGNIYNIDCG